MKNMDRRDFLAAALSGLGGLGLAGCVDSPTEGMLVPDLGPRADFDTAAGVHVRRNIYCLGETHPDVVAYRAGVTAMKARPDTNPTSWLAQANIHGAFSPPPGMLANLCQHNNLFFLSWHRMYLYFFERIVRASGGNPNFALPYWGYTPTGARNLPAHFRVPANSTNVLYVSARNASINAGNNLSSSAVDPGAALALIPFGSFSTSLEGTPHGVVHVGVGGWMSAFATAAQDPIFWLHHSMIDRLWNVWIAQGGGRVNPTTASWLNTPFSFYNEYCATVTLTGAQIVNTATQLCYRYGPLPCLAVADPVDAATLVHPMDLRAAEVADPIGPRPPRAEPLPLAEAQVGVRLGPTPVEVRLPVPAAAREALRSFEKDEKAGNDFALHLRDIALAAPAQVYYEVYANLPTDAKDTTYAAPHYVGNVDFFGIPSSSSQDGLHAAHVAHSRRLSLLRAYALLRSRGEWKDDEVRLTFVPRAYTEDQEAARIAPATQATIGSISLSLE